jgi:RHS repeat-associated protein
MARSARNNVCKLRSILLAGAVLVPAFASTGFAQTATPAFRNLDGNGVDLTHGDVLIDFKEGSVGSGKSELAIRRWSGVPSGTQWDSVTFTRYSTLVGGAYKTTVVIGNEGRWSDIFEGSNDAGYVAKKNNGAVLVGGGANFTYISPNGTETTFSDPSFNSGGETNFCVDGRPDVATCFLLPSEIKDPSQSSVYLTWELHGIFQGDNFPQDASYNWRLSRVANAFGYAIDFAYAADATTNTPAPPNWYNRTSARFSAENGQVNAGQVTYAYPSTGVIDVTDLAGQTWRVSGWSVRRPGEATPAFNATYSGTSVNSVVNGGVTTTYNRSVSGTTATTVVTNALGQTTTVESDLTIGRPTKVTDALGRVTTYQYDTAGRIMSITAPELNRTEMTYDSRGNVTEQRAVAKPGWGAATIVTSATYPATCDNYYTCNKPISTTDARGAVTNYDYDPNNGGLTAVTLPAGAPGGVRPQTRFAYSELSTGYELTQVSACRTLASCANTADETRSTYSYDSRGNVVGVTRSAGDGSLSQTVTATYDARGDLTSIDGALPGAADTTIYQYDSARRQTLAVAPDPDGGGAARGRADFRHYDAAGRVTQIDQGTANPDGSGFAAAEAVQISYDVNGRKVAQTLAAGGTTYAQTTFGYDGVGRASTTTVKMFGQGSDRVMTTSYDAVGRVSGVTSASGTAEASTEMQAYTANGQVQSVTDGNGNTTTYSYEGHDRRYRTTYVDGTFDEVAFDAGSNIIARRLRDSNLITFTVDTLNRPTAKSFSNGEAGVSYGYDLQGHVTSVNKGAMQLTFGWNAVGQLTSEGQPYGSMSYGYDVAGRRSRVTWHDGFFVDYDYDTVGAMTAIRENGGAALATYGYDALGRRASITRGNGTVTGYGYDAVSRLASLTQDLAGNARDVSLSFGFNPASQITSVARSNDAYAWTAGSPVDRPYTVNGLNQFTSSGNVSLGYDAKGNLTSSGSTTYVYSSENMLVGVPGVATLDYDGLNRLIGYTVGVSTRFVYDGMRMATEVANPSGSILRRYVYGPGLDEPVVWYEGAGTADKRWLHADERGSVIAVTDAGGASMGVNSYDEFGIPGAANIGRFQYTGQAFLPEIGLYHYKARTYSPTLGRFLQTDPIGYADGLNWYNYVGGDPVNATDPMGLMTQAQCLAAKAAIDAAIEAGADPSGFDILVCGGGSGGGSFGGGIISIGSAGGLIGGSGAGGAMGGAPPPAPASPQNENPLKPETRKYLCGKLGANNGNVPKTYRDTLSDRRSRTNGRSNWGVPAFRQAENFLYATGQWRNPSTDGSTYIGVYFHQYAKYVFSGTSEFSQDALDAGLAGVDHKNDSPAELKEFLGCR